MVPLWMTLSDLWPGLQGYDIFLKSNIWKTAQLRYIHLPLNVSHGGFVSISWASRLHKHLVLSHLRRIHLLLGLIVLTVQLDRFLLEPGSAAWIPEFRITSRYWRINAAKCHQRRTWNARIETTGDRLRGLHKVVYITAFANCCERLVSEWVGPYTSPSTKNRPFRRRVFLVNHLRSLVLTTLTKYQPRNKIQTNAK